MKNQANTPPTRDNRYDYLDNLKWLLTILVILHHAAAVAGLDPTGFNLAPVALQYQWQYKTLIKFQGDNQSYFMGLFFFLSALFVVPSFHKKGYSKFISDKFKRLGIPTLIFPFIILPFISYSSAIDNIKKFLATGNINLGVTWFCWTLIVFNLIWLFVTFLFNDNKSPKEPKQIPKMRKITLFASILVPISYAALGLENILGENFFGLHLIKYFPMYIVMFYFGIKTYENKWLEQIELKHAFYGIIIWYLSRNFLSPIFNGYGINYDMASNSFSSIGMTMFLVYIFKQLFNHTTKFTIIMSRTAFAAYVWQVLILYLVAKYLHPFITEMPLVNFVIIGIPSVILSFGMGYIICKLPLMKNIF